jgi:hypothetical protein
VSNVGRSWRTHAKHELMSSILGQEVGSVSRMPSLARHAWFDLTAGDAALVDGCEWHKSCSPGILAYHATTTSAIPTVITLHEIQPATYDRLLGNLSMFLPRLGYHQQDANRWYHTEKSVWLLALNESGANVDIGFVQPTDAVFVLNDPNAITEWALRDGFAQEIRARGVWAHRSLSTLGCNPAGLKRLHREERQLWFDSIEAEQAASPHYRDMLLAAIERDDAQWAYLISTAEKWRSSAELRVKAAFKKVGRTAAMAWARRDRTEFEDLKKVLFLTKKEREGDAA